MTKASRQKLRQELTLLRIDRHSSELGELDVEGILAFAERILPRAADLWVQASLEQRQRFQQLFSAFNYLRGIETGNEGLVDLTRDSWNRIVAWLAHLDALQPVAPVRIRLDYSLPGVPS